jgi:hypothetical protein
MKHNTWIMRVSVNDNQRGMVMVDILRAGSKKLHMPENASRNKKAIVLKLLD